MPSDLRMKGFHRRSERMNGFENVANSTSPLWSPSPTILLVSSCPSCANPVAIGSRFCPTCGFALAATMVEERRVITVLFADLVGFTSLSEHLDPEQVKRMVDACFERLVDDITTFGGTVDKFVGDGIVALFGVPLAHEDDAERAVRAALRMQDTLCAFRASRAALVSTEDLQM